MNSEIWAVSPVLAGRVQVARCDVFPPAHSGWERPSLPTRSPQQSGASSPPPPPLPRLPGTFLVEAKQQGG